MKDLTLEIEKATKWVITFMQEYMISFAINKRGFDFEWDYGEGTMNVYKGDKPVGIILMDFPLGFILEEAYDEFMDDELKEEYHIVKIDDFGKEEWCLDVKKMKEIAPSLQWIYNEDNVPIDTSKFCIADFDYCIK